MKRKVQKINEIYSRIRSHKREHNSIVSQDGWDSADFKRKIIKQLENKIYKLIKDEKNL
jgi:hypothetical protein